MSTIEAHGTVVQLDNEGFLRNYREWDEDVARKLADREGFASLDEEQLEVIRFMRTYYEKYHAFPILQYVCKNLDQPRDCVNEEFINPMKAWKIAGLPKPDGIQFTTFDGTHYRMEECC